MNNRKWFKSAQFGMMVHWELYSLPAARGATRKGITGAPPVWMESPIDKPAAPGQNSCELSCRKSGCQYFRVLYT
jgi:hypothetical protein